MSSKLAQEARKTLKSRSIRVLVSPTPVTFAERRAVLQVMEQTGPIEHFRMVPNYHSNFVSLTRTTDTADSLINRSPITYRLPSSRFATNAPFVSSDSHSVKSSEESDQVSSSCQPPGAAHENPAGARPGGQFTLNVWPAEDFSHAHSSAASPLHGAWPESYKNDRSSSVQFLKQTLPKTIAAEGMAYWLTDFGENASPKGKAAQRLEVKKWVPTGMVKEK